MTMIDRRQALLAGVALAVAPAMANAGADSEGRFQMLLDVFMAENLDASPEIAAALGVDTGARAWERRKLDPRTLTAVAETKTRLVSQLHRLRAFDREPLSQKARVSYDVIRYCLENADAAGRRYAYGPGAAVPPYLGAGAPYVISQLTGAYSAIPTFLASQHPIGDKTDADAYLARLSAFAAALDQEIELVRHDVAHGCTPPDFALDKTLRQMQDLRAPAPAVSSLVTGLAARAKDRGLTGDYAGAASKIVADAVYPALDRQIALVRELRATASHDAGVWKFPAGDRYYADALTAWTSSSYDPEAIHRMGLSSVDESTARIDDIMRRQGLSEGTVAERLRAMFTDTRFRYPNTDDGKAQLIADLNARVADMRARLPAYFGVLPKAEVVVRRIPAYMETSRPSGYYQPPTMDEGKPGVFFINLRDTGETPRWVLPTRTFHQTIPGHHLKFSLYQEARLPLIRNMDFYATYMEGWSLYAEQLADEMGMYEADALGRIGYLQSRLRASVAAVVDTGLHVKRWSREEGIAYFSAHLGDPPAAAATEIERYCVWPGQVCTYLLDLQAITGLREKARAALGERFDMRRFHDAILLCGDAPQVVLERVVDDYISTARGA